MTLGRSTAGAIKIKTDGGLRAVSCGCCCPGSVDFYGDFVKGCSKSGTNFLGLTESSDADGNYSNVATIRNLTQRTISIRVYGGGTGQDVAYTKVTVNGAELTPRCYYQPDYDPENTYSFYDASYLCPGEETSFILGPGESFTHFPENSGLPYYVLYMHWQVMNFIQ